MMMTRLISNVRPGSGSEDAVMDLQTLSSLRCATRHVRRSRRVRWGTFTAAVAGLVLSACGGLDPAARIDDTRHLAEAPATDCGPSTGGPTDSAQDSSTDPIPGRPRCTPAASPIVPDTALASHTLKVGTR